MSTGFKRLVCVLLGLGVVVCVTTFSLDRSAEKDANEVSREALGADWPFATIEEGTVECDGKGSAVAATFVAGGRRYALNGTSKTRFGHPFPHEAGIVRKIPLDARECAAAEIPPARCNRNADTDALLRICIPTLR